jgi:hypothetical protein
VYFTVSSNIISTFCFCQMYRIKHMFLSLNCIFEVKKIFFHLNTNYFLVKSMECNRVHQDKFEHICNKQEFKTTYKNVEIQFSVHDTVSGITIIMFLDKIKICKMKMTKICMYSCHTINIDILCI